MKTKLRKSLTFITVLVIMITIICSQAMADTTTAIYNAADLFSNRDLLQEADLTQAVAYTVSDDQDIHISEAGVYVLTGTAKNVTVSILCDNAVKYAADNGEINVSAKTEGRNIIFTVANDVTVPLSKEQCSHLFDRFYRTDPSRSKEKQSGFGIGLSIATAITEKHGGSISI